jgi:hypothetical protein
MGLWHKYAWVAYLAVFLSVCGHASSEFVSVLCGIKGPELSVWRFLLGSFGLVTLALMFPASRNLFEPFREYGSQLVWLSILGISIGYLLFHWSLDYATVPQVATMVTTGPIFVGLVNLWLNKQPFTAAKIISGVSAMIGVALLVTDGYLAKLAGPGESFIGILMAMAHHCHHHVFGRHRPVDRCGSILEDLGESGYAFSTRTQPSGLVADSGFLEYHDCPIPLERRAGGRTGYHARQLSFLSQASHRCRSGRRILGSRLNRMAAAGNYHHLHVCSS